MGNLVAASALSRFWFTPRGKERKKCIIFSFFSWGEIMAVCVCVWDERDSCAPLSGCLLLSTWPASYSSRAGAAAFCTFSWSSRHVRHRGAAPSLIWIPPRFRVRRPSLCHTAHLGRRDAARLAVRTGVCGRESVRRADNGSTFSPASRRNRAGPPRQCLNFLVWAPWIFFFEGGRLSASRIAPVEIWRVFSGWNSQPEWVPPRCVCVC